MTADDLPTFTFPEPEQIIEKRYWWAATQQTVEMNEADAGVLWHETGDGEHIVSSWEKVDHDVVDGKEVIDRRLVKQSRHITWAPASMAYTDAAHEMRQNLTPTVSQELAANLGDDYGKDSKFVGVMRNQEGSIRLHCELESLAGEDCAVCDCPVCARDREDNPYEEDLPMHDGCRKSCGWRVLLHSGHGRKARQAYGDMRRRYLQAVVNENVLAHEQGDPLSPPVTCSQERSRIHRDEMDADLERYEREKMAKREEAEKVPELQETIKVGHQLASALEDFLSGDGWHLAYTLKRLLAGEITPQEALDETDE